jgi:hypothetical protein
MIQIDHTLYNKLEKISNNVENRLKQRGIAVPVRQDNGSIQVGRYTIEKFDGFYQILDDKRNIIVSQINLPQTAAVLANDLALNRFLDNIILQFDRSYGYADFEEKLNKKLAYRSIKKNLEKAEMLFTKSAVKKSKKDHYKRQITTHFEKLFISNK